MYYDQERINKGIQQNCDLRQLRFCHFDGALVDVMLTLA